jgi:hypothetical protein
MRNAITVIMDAADFARLPGAIAIIRTDDFATMQHGLLDADGRPIQMARIWKRAYWFYGDYAAVILARSFLAAIGEEHQLAMDEAVSNKATGETFGWTIFTDYEPKADI